LGWANKLLAYGFNLFLVGFVGHLFYPTETKGKSLEALEKEFRDEMIVFLLKKNASIEYNNSVSLAKSISS